MPKGDAKEGYLNTNAHLEAKVALLMAQLAESQAREAKLCKLIHDGCLCIAQYGEQPPQPLLDAIAMQTDTSALREMIAAEREACIEGARTVGGPFAVECEALIRARGCKP